MPKIVLCVTGLQTAIVPRLQTFIKYARVEMKPPMPAEFPAVTQGFSEVAAALTTGKVKQMTVKVGAIFTYRCTSLKKI